MYTDLSDHLISTKYNNTEYTYRPIKTGLTGFYYYVYNIEYSVHASHTHCSE